MIPRPVAHYLIHFEPADGAQAPGEAATGDPSPEPPDEPPVEDPALAVQSARDEGFAEGLAAARGEYEARIEQERLAFEARLAAERERWAREESETLGEKIETAFAAIESNIAGSVERVLKPFVIGELRGQMIDMLAGNIGVLLRGKDHPVIEIRGPEDLLAMLRAKLPAHSAGVEYFPGDSIDVQIVAGQTAMDTQLEAWIQRIGALRGEADAGS